MSGHDRAAAIGWRKFVAALLCTAAAGTFICFRLRGPTPARVAPAIESAGGLMGRRTARANDASTREKGQPDETRRQQPERGALP